MNPEHPTDDQPPAASADPASADPSPHPTPHPGDAPAFGRTASGPLAGITVADFSRVLAGPYATMFLADLGATVIKVEGPSGDETRGWRPPVRGGEATYFLGVNRNKYDVVLDFKDPGDLELAHTLAARADVVVENFKAGGLKKFGLDYESVVATNPAVIYASITGFGAKNPQPGYDLLVQGLSGFMSVTGEPEATGGRPTKAGVAIFDVITGLHTALGIVSALHHRNTTGEGQHVETNLLSSALSGLANQASAYVTGGVTPTRMGNEHPSLYPYLPLPTGDGDMLLAVGNDRQFVSLCQVLGIEHIAADSRFATNAGRTSNRELLAPVLIEALSQRSAHEWYDLLTAAGVPCAPINTVAQGVELAERLGLEPVVTAVSTPTVANPIRLSATPVSYDLDPPGLGQDSEVVKAWLRS